MRRMIFWKSNGNNMKTSAIPAWSAPLTNNDILSIKYPLAPARKPRPIRHWRKQLIPRQKTSGNRGSSTGMPIDIPGHQVIYTAQNCHNTLQLKNNVERHPPLNKCPECIPQNNRIRTAMVKRIPYYNPHSSQYLTGVCKTYEQNIGIADMNKDHRKCDNIRKPLKVDEPQNTCGKAILYNPQGAVSSSAQIKTKKYNNLTSFHINNYSANSLANQNFGHTEGEYRNSMLHTQTWENCKPRTCFKVFHTEKIARACRCRN